jgi:hypothetical protein
MLPLQRCLLLLLPLLLLLKPFWHHLPPLLLLQKPLWHHLLWLLKPPWHHLVLLVLPSCAAFCQLHGLHYQQQQQQAVAHPSWLHSCAA